MNILIETQFNSGGVHLQAAGEIAGASSGAQDGRQSVVIGPVVAEQINEETETVAVTAVLVEAGDEDRPRDQVPAAQFVEQSPRVVQAAAFGVKVDEVVGDGEGEVGVRDRTWRWTAALLGRRRRRAQERRRAAAERVEEGAVKKRRRASSRQSCSPR